MFVVTLDLPNKSVIQSSGECVEYIEMSVSIVSQNVKF